MITSVVDNNDAIIGYYQTLQQSNPSYECIKLKGLNKDEQYTLETRKQFTNVEHFGPLINDELPINIKVGGLIHSTISRNYLYPQEVESIIANGDELMYAGFLPLPQFPGTEFSDKVRFIGDFGSRLYTLKQVSKK